MIIQHNQKIRHNNKAPEYSEVLYLFKAVYFLCEYYGISAGCRRSRLLKSIWNWQHRCAYEIFLHCGWFVYVPCGSCIPGKFRGSGTVARRRAEALEGRPGVQGFLPSLRIAALLLQRLLLFEFSTMPITTESHFTQICIFYLATTRLSCCCFYFGDWL